MVYSLGHLIICCVAMILFGIAIGWYIGFNKGAKVVSDEHKNFMSRYNLEYRKSEDK